MRERERERERERDSLPYKRPPQRRACDMGKRERERERESE